MQIDHLRPDGGNFLCADDIFVKVALRDSAREPILRGAELVDHRVDLVMSRRVMRLKSLERILHILAGPREADVAYRDLHASLRSLGPEEVMRKVLLKADSLVRTPDRAIAVQLGNDDPDHEQDAQFRT